MWIKLGRIKQRSGTQKEEEEKKEKNRVVPSSKKKKERKKPSCAFVLPLPSVCLRNLQLEQRSLSAVCGGFTVCTHFNHTTWINSLSTADNLSLQRYFQLVSASGRCMLWVSGRISQLNVAAHSSHQSQSVNSQWTLPLGTSFSQLLRLQDKEDTEV